MAAATGLAALVGTHGQGAGQGQPGGAERGGDPVAGRLLARRLAACDLVRGKPVKLTKAKKAALAAWSVKFALMLQLVCPRDSRFVIPDSDYLPLR